MRRRRQRSVKLPRSVRRLFPGVRYAVDSTRSAAISVTPQDALHAKKMRPEACALARAVCRQFHAEGAIIGMSYSYVIRGEYAIRYKTPVTVGREITSFDRHDDFAVGDYKLSRVSPSQRLGRNSEPHGGGGHSTQRVVHRGTVRVRDLKG